MDQVWSEAPSEHDKAYVIREAPVNASEAGLKCAEVVDIFHDKAEKQEAWKLLCIDKIEFNRQIQYDDIAASAI